MNKKFPSAVQLIEVSLVFEARPSNSLFQKQKSALFEEFQKSLEVEVLKAELCSQEGFIVEERRDDDYESKLAEIGFKSKDSV